MYLFSENWVDYDRVQDVSPILFVQIHNACTPIPEEVLHGKFSQFGLVQRVGVSSESDFKFLVQFEFLHCAIFAKWNLQGHRCQEECGVLDIKYFHRVIENADEHPELPPHEETQEAADSIGDRLRKVQRLLANLQMNHPEFVSQCSSEEIVVPCSTEVHNGDVKIDKELIDVEVDEEPAAIMCTSVGEVQCDIEICENQSLTVGTEENSIEIVAEYASTKNWQPHDDGDDFVDDNDVEFESLSPRFKIEPVQSREANMELGSLSQRGDEEVSERFPEVRDWSCFPTFDPGIYIKHPNTSTFRDHDEFNELLRVAHGVMYNVDRLESSLPLLLLGAYFRLEEFDPFWIATLDSTIEARQRLILRNLVFTCSNKLFLHLMTQRHLKILLKGGHVFLGRAIVRDYDGFNGPGSSQGPFNFGLALVRDYDGFNGPGHTLRTRCL